MLGILGNKMETFNKVYPGAVNLTSAHKGKLLKNGNLRTETTYYIIKPPPSPSVLLYFKDLPHFF